MINLTNASLKIYLALQPCDMRKSFNGLTEIVTEHLGQELVKEAIFAFVNKRRNPRGICWRRAFCHQRP